MAKLYIVGTPIGNLGDMTLRGIETLKNADVVACEDTRHSLPLLSHFGIKKELVAYHKFNEAECSERLIEMILSGKNVALITDAGMPSVSDPGAEIVTKCRERGVDVEVVPGPTAVMSALALSGIKSKGFVFLGFLPEKKAEIEDILSKTAFCGLPIALYVAPHDLKKTAATLLKQLGDRTAYVCRELTKLHECVEVTSLASFECEERGEIVLIVDSAPADNPLNELPVEEHVRRYIAQGYSKKDAVKRAAQDRGVPKNEVYQACLDLD